MIRYKVYILSKLQDYFSLMPGGPDLRATKTLSVFVKPQHKSGIDFTKKCTIFDVGGGGALFHIESV